MLIIKPILFWEEKCYFFPPLYFIIVVVVALTPHYDSPRCLAANPAVLRCPFQKARGATQMAHMPGRHKHVVNPVLKCCKIICLFHIIKYKSYNVFIYLLIFKSTPSNCQLFSIWIFFSLFKKSSWLYNLIIYAQKKTKTYLEKEKKTWKMIQVYRNVMVWKTERIKVPSLHFALIFWWHWFGSPAPRSLSLVSNRFGCDHTPC